MGIETMNEIQEYGFVRDSECVGCQTCVQACDHGAIRYATALAAAPASPAAAPSPREPRARQHLELSLRTELFLLPFVLAGALAGVPGIVWGTMFMLCSASTLLALWRWVRARRAPAGLHAPGPGRRR